MPEKFLSPFAGRIADGGRGRAEAESVDTDANCAPTNVGRAPASPKTEGRKRKLGRKSRGAFSVSLYSVTTRRKMHKNAVECGFMLRVLPNSILANDLEGFRGKASPNPSAIVPSRYGSSILGNEGTNVVSWFCLLLVAGDL
jgi:hypothetical protein